MAFKPPEGKGRPPMPVAPGAPGEKSPAPAPDKIRKPAAKAERVTVSERLVSLDAYRGATMLLLASGGFSIARVLERHRDILTRFEGRWFSKPWAVGWQTLANQTQHVAWTGCTVWDLIQPSFMFMVGVAMPFSYASRTARGESWVRQFAHAIVRALALILLGIFLRSVGAREMTNFTFEDVVTQIGLGYVFVFLLLPAPIVAQLAAVVAILGGYWFFFYHFPLPPPEGNQVTRFLTEVGHARPSAWNQFTGVAAHWNKFTNAAAEFDRTFLNLFPRSGKEWEGRNFWVNGGGYTTLNFIPSMATMLFGVMAGKLLRGPRTPRQKLQWLVAAGTICFLISMGIDTTIWPIQFPRASYSFGPVVKRIWTPSWAVFSAGWAFWILAAFYWFIDMRGFRRLGFPLAIVGMNAIAVYCIIELLDGWLAAMLKIHLSAVDAAAHTSLVKWLFDESAFVYAPIFRQLAVVVLIWLICLWMYRRRLFVRL